MPTWDAAVGWTAPQPRLDWKAAEAWQPSLDALASVTRRGLLAELERWDAVFAGHGLGLDPSRTDWTQFRPLRLSREEDWSDWLAHLLEHARDAELAARLFAKQGEARVWKVSRCEREVTAGDYRADLVVELEDETWLHLELKVGDLRLDKTVATGDQLRRRASGMCRGDWLLLPDEDVDQWRKLLAQDAAFKGITIITWHDVARALRGAALAPGVETVWRAWAYTFLGAVEQHLLGFAPIPLNAESWRPSANDVGRLKFFESIREAT